VVTRRSFLSTSGISAVGATASWPRAGKADTSRRLAITMDDVNWRAIPPAYSSRANEQILSHLAGRRIKAGLFVTGANVDSERGAAILASWNDAGHMLGNHTWHHRLQTRSTPEEFEREILACESLVERYPRYRRFFRFPALKEGRSAEQRDTFRGVLHRLRYRNGYVTVDASDWYYDARLRAMLAAEPAFGAARFRGPYVDHIVDRAEYYDNLVRRTIGRTIPHTLLIHYNLLNALFLSDVLDALAARGWSFGSAEDAYEDPVFSSEPQIAPAGESLAWALAKESGRFEGELRYPGEDDVYEAPKLAKLGL
jgi:peptidoglycan/xylan/chitin deacetylase (PgdA/CDA1 family)